MRTKTLLLTAAFCAAGIATSVAQVYSVNAVGYVNKTIPANGLALISNPLDAGATGNQVRNLFASVPDGTAFFYYNPATGFVTGDKDFGEFTEPLGSTVLRPGDGIFVRNPTATPLQVTFVGEVQTGNLSNPITAGLSIKSSQVPQRGTLTQLAFPAAEGDTVFQWNPASQSYVPFQFDFGEWAPTVPTIDVGEAFFVQKVAASTWSRTFNVNQ